MSKKKVLVIDDHPSIRFLIRSLVETDDFSVCGEAADGLEGVEKAKQLAPDLILLDFSMPLMNGAETARILKKLMPQVPIILFTLDSESVNKALAAAMGVDRVIAKSDGMRSLLECMRNVLELGPKTIGPLAVSVDNAGLLPSLQIAPSDQKTPE